LQLNREIIESQSARHKINATHFSGREINMQPFMDMLGLDHSPSCVYQILRAVPSLLEKAERKD
jgi:hypothetical protein